MQKYMPVPDASLHAHCTSLASIGSKHKQMHLQVCVCLVLHRQIVSCTTVGVFTVASHITFDIE